MCEIKKVKFDVLRDSDKDAIKEKFRDGDASKSRRITFHDNTVWLLAPESRSFKAVVQATEMIRSMAKPKEIFITEVPLSFIEGAAA